MKRHFHWIGLLIVTLLSSCNPIGSEQQKVTAEPWKATTKQWKVTTKQWQTTAEHWKAIAIYLSVSPTTSPYFQGFSYIGGSSYIGEEYAELDALMTLGDKALEAGRHVEAVNHYRQIVDIFETAYEEHDLYGAPLISLHRVNMFLYNLTHDLIGGAPLIYNNLSKALIQLGEVEESLIVSLKKRNRAAGAIARAASLNASSELIEENLTVEKIK